MEQNKIEREHVLYRTNEVGPDHLPGRLEFGPTVVASAVHPERSNCQARFEAAWPWAPEIKIRTSTTTRTTLSSSTTRITTTKTTCSTTPTSTRSTKTKNNHIRYQQYNRENAKFKLQKLKTIIFPFNNIQPRENAKLKLVLQIQI